MNNKNEVLGRILSLIPKKSNGEFRHGAKAQFCRSINISSQTLSDWISGRSTSFMDKLFQISVVHHVPLEWLETGKTVEEAVDEDRADWMEEREMLQTIRDKDLRNMMDGFKNMTPAQIRMMERFMRSLMEDDNAD